MRSTMLDRAIRHAEQDPARTYTLNELRLAAGVAIRSQYRLSEQLLASGVMERCAGGYRIHEFLRQKGI